MKLASALDQAEHVHDNANVVVSLYFGVQSLLLAWLSLEVHRGANRAATRSGSRRFPVTILLSPILTDWLSSSTFPSSVFFGYRRPRSIDYDDWILATGQDVFQRGSLTLRHIMDACHESK
ncbi:unnamed protein product [Cercospora beticola]|nr:unnamed protein product [Cercospora beticola]